MNRIFLRSAVALAALAAFGPLTGFAQNSATGPVGTWFYTATIPGETPADTVVLQGLERSFADKGYYMPVYLPTDSRLDYLKADPRLIDLKRRMRLPEVTH